MEQARHVFATGKLHAAWLERAASDPACTGSLADAAKAPYTNWFERTAQPETIRLWRTACQWWKELEILNVTAATTAKAEAIDSAIKHIKRTGQGFTNARNYKTYLLQCRKNSGLNLHHEFIRNREEPDSAAAYRPTSRDAFGGLVLGYALLFSLTGLAGIPTAVTPAGMLDRTSAWAPMRTRSPTITPPSTVAPVPIMQSLPMVGYIAGCTG